MLQRPAVANFLKRIRLSSNLFSVSRGTSDESFPISLTRKLRFSYRDVSRGHSGRVDDMNLRLWLILTGQAAIFLGVNGDPALAKDVPIESSFGNEMEGANGLRKIEDGSVVSNIHTSKWRVFTDKGREFFLQGKLEDAEKLFISALHEAKEGFGDRDPHVASACNNLAELYRVKKVFDKAEPLYLEAITILEDSYGPDDIRSGVAFHNLGQFYLVQKKLEESRGFYERALKIKRRVLGHDNTDYADTMYHLGTVLYLQGKVKDAITLVQDSIDILEKAGEGESIMCIRRLRYLSQIYLKSNLLKDAENVQRKILHIMELTKGWNSIETVYAAEVLGMTLQLSGNLSEAQELLERCLDTRKAILPENHLQIGGNMLHIARVVMLKSSQLKNMDIAKFVEELDKAKDLVDNSARIAQNVLNKTVKQKGSINNTGVRGESRRDGHAALVILLQSLDTLGILESTRKELQQSKEDHSSKRATENALLKCISSYKEFEIFGDSPEVKLEYLSCLKRLASLLSDTTTEGSQQFKGITPQKLEDEIKRIEAAISSYKRHKQQSTI